jgi:hypothetical protein
MMADGSLLRSRAETWGAVWPDNVHETGVSPGGWPGIPSWPRKRNRSSELDERPDHGPDPRFLCPTAHGVRCGPTMFTKQVSPPGGWSDPPIVAAEVEQVERTRRRTWSRARSEVSVPFRPESSLARGRRESTAQRGCRDVRFTIKRSPAGGDAERYIYPDAASSHVLMNQALETRSVGEMSARDELGGARPS